MQLNTSNRRHYDILTGLRGPDFHGPIPSIAKDVTTAVLRWLVGMRHPSHCIINSPGDAKDRWDGLTPEVRQEVSNFLVNEPHFERHFRYGMISLIKEEIDPNSPITGGMYALAQAKRETTVAEQYLKWYEENVLKPGVFVSPFDRPGRVFSVSGPAV
jgi:hypothetical protein